MNKEQMKGRANDIFKRYPNKDKVFVTSDGQAFFEESRTKNHAVKNRTGKELEVERFLRKGEGSAIKKNSKDAIAEIQATETIEAVSALLESEKQGENRKTVIDAAEKRIVELNTL